MLAERLLHRMQRRAVGGKALDGPDLVAVGHHRKGGAGFHRLAVEMHHAGAALRGIAADMGAGQPQVFAQKLDQQGAGVDIGVNGIAVHDHGNFGHSALSSSALPHPDSTAYQDQSETIIWAIPAMSNLTADGLI